MDEYVKINGLRIIPYAWCPDDELISYRKDSAFRTNRWLLGMGSDYAGTDLLYRIIQLSSMNGGLTEMYISDKNFNLLKEAYPHNVRTSRNPRYPVDNVTVNVWEVD